MPTDITFEEAYEEVVERHFNHEVSCFRNGTEFVPLRPRARTSAIILATNFSRDDIDELIESIITEVNQRFMEVVDNTLELSLQKFRA